jgi:hypothetical protein
MVTRNREGVTCHLPGLDQRIVVPALAAGADDNVRRHQAPGGHELAIHPLSTLLS